MAEQTGGRHFPVENLNELPDVAAKIGIELRNQYVLGYVPKNAKRDGKYRRVQVKINQPRGCRRYGHSGVKDIMPQLNRRVFGLALAGSALAAAQDQEETGLTFRSDTREVLLHATVVDRKGAFVTDIPERCFQDR